MLAIYPSLVAYIFILYVLRVPVLEVTSNYGCNGLESRLPVKGLMFSCLSPFVFQCCMIPILVIILSALETISRTNLVTIFVAMQYMILL